MSQPRPRLWRAAGLALVSSVALNASAAPVAGNATVETFRRAEFKIVAKQDELSPEIRAAMAAYLKNQALADPGRKWNAADASADPTLPARRLTMAGYGKTVAFVAYEHGGTAKHAHVVLLSLDDGKAAVAYACAGAPIVPMNLDGLRAAVRKKSCAPVAGTEEDEK